MMNLSIEPFNGDSTYFFESIAKAMVFYFGIVMLVICLSMIRFADLPEREVEVPKITVRETPKF